MSELTEQPLNPPTDEVHITPTTDWDAVLDARYAAFEATVLDYLPDADLEMLRDAWQMCREKHAPQRRQSGEPYAAHPLAVAEIVAKTRLGVPGLCAAFLHDVVEDTDTPIEEIEARFGELVASFVEGLTKLSRIDFRSKEEHQAENLRKLILAMTEDIRVVLIKLADRLHNSRTLDACPPNKQKRIAQETLEIYAQLAGRLGINWIKSELEDHSFKYLEPEAYQELKTLVQQKRSEREAYAAETVAILREMLADAGIDAEVSGRPKHFYSMWRKMRRSKIDFKEIYDATAFRVLVNDKATCYNVLGHVHDQWHPVAGRFKDYIAVPKRNGYQSLHTTVIGPKGERVEIQIRTHEMHQTAEFGVAAHWIYKEGGETNVKNPDTFQWMRTLVESQAEIDDSLEYLESLKLDLFDDEVFVFTPQGDIKALPRGATPLDFAYAVHSEVGHHAAHARINGRHVSLRQQLENGDVVEIITREDQHPHEEWLEIAQSSRARSRIRAYIGKEKRENARAIGEELLSAELRKNDLKFATVEKEGKLQKAAEALKLNNVDQLLIDIGYGRHQADSVVSFLLPDRGIAKKVAPLQTPKRFSTGNHRAAVADAPRVAYVVGLRGNVMTSFARCCNPLPGEDITGYVTRGRGVTIHVSSCDQLEHLEPERLVEVAWMSEEEMKGTPGRRTVRMRVIAENEQNTLVSIITALSEKKITINEMRTREGEDRTGVVTLSVNVSTAKQLRAALKSIEELKGIISADRL